MLGKTNLAQKCSRKRLRAVDGRAFGIERSQLVRRGARLLEPNLMARAVSLSSGPKPRSPQRFFSTPTATIVQSLRGHARRFSALDLARKFMRCAPVAPRLCAYGSTDGKMIVWGHHSFCAHLNNIFTERGEHSIAVDPSPSIVDVPIPPGPGAPCIGAFTGCIAFIMPVGPDDPGVAVAKH